MTKKSKIIIFSSIGLVFILALTTFLVFWIPPKKDNYRLSIVEIGWMEQDTNGNKTSKYVKPEENEVCEIPLGISINFYSHLLNSSKRKQVISFEGENVIRTKIFRGNEVVAETENTDTKTHTLEFMNVLPGFSNCTVEADCFVYDFMEAGSYTIVAESAFTQKWKSYSYQTEPITVVVK